MGTFAPRRRGIFLDTCRLYVPPPSHSTIDSLTTASSLQTSAPTSILEMQSRRKLLYTSFSF